MENLRQQPLPSTSENVPSFVTVPQEGRTEAQRMELSERILGFMRANEPLSRNISTTLYTMLTSRLSSKEHKMTHETLEGCGATEAYRRRLVTAVTQLQSGGLQVSNNGAWFGVSQPHRQARAKESIHRTYKGETKNALISLKEYFTLAFDAQSNITEQSSAFVENITKLAHILDELGQKHDEVIKLKIPATLEELIDHPDSIVIHYRKRGLGPLIRTAVSSCMGPRLSNRMQRSNSGFDLDGSFPYDGSHSQLIATAVASKLTRDAKEHRDAFSQTDTAAFSLWLEKVIATYNLLSESELLSCLDAVEV
jgi:hypothetical protein